jgi:hypothetical protein
VALRPRLATGLPLSHHHYQDALHVVNYILLTNARKCNIHSLFGDSGGTSTAAVLLAGAVRTLGVAAGLFALRRRGAQRAERGRHWLPRRCYDGTCSRDAFSYPLPPAWSREAKTNPRAPSRCGGIRRRRSAAMGQRERGHSVLGCRRKGAQTPEARSCDDRSALPLPAPAQARAC